MRYLLLLSTLCALHCGYGQTLSGSIYDDKNHNGHLDQGEKLLAGVGISDGDTIVWSNRRGHYTLPLKPRQAWFVIAPNGYVSRRGGIQNPTLVAAGANAPTYNFALYATTDEDHFRVAVVGDIQVDSEEQLSFASRSVLSELASRNDLNFWVHMGDLANDKPALLREALSLAATLPSPMWCVVGNHDLDGEIKPRTGVGFREAAGSDVAAFFRGQTCFILLNNVEEADPQSAQRQLRFLKLLTNRCPKKTLLVVCQHVPMADASHREELLEVLAPHKTLILTAHAHRTFRKLWTPKIAEVSVGAACGSWWTGERDVWGIPVALQQCGSPRNYFVFDFSGNNYTFRFKGVGMDADVQADVWIKGENSIDNNLPQLQQEADGTMLVNVYGGGETTRVEYSIDTLTWHPLEPTKILAPALAQMTYMNKNGGYPTKFSRRQPVRKMVSPHIWRGTLPDSLQHKPLLLNFRVTDTHGLAPFGFRRTVATILN